jgi:uncharacterized protein (UPF0335 family)
MTDDNTTAARLTSFIERIERLEEDKANIANDIKEVYAEAKGEGFEVKPMRQLVKLRKMKREARKELEEYIEIYKAALGMG